jgi:uncharacterized protein
VCDTVRVHSEQLHRGIDLFNSAEFFEAHEVLEDVWRAAPEPERKFFQGLIQIAVGLHHHSRGNLIGCQSLLARAARNLSRYPAQHAGLDVAALLEIVADWRQALETRQPVPPLPKLDLLKL